MENVIKGASGIIARKLRANTAFADQPNVPAAMPIGTKTKSPFGDRPDTAVFSARGMCHRSGAAGIPKGMFVFSSAGEGGSDMALEWLLPLQPREI